MSEGKPYDPNQLLRLTEQVELHGPVIDAPVPVANTAGVHEPGFEHYPGRVEEALTAISGIGRVLKTEGRAERAREKAAQLEKRTEVVGSIADRIASPRQTTKPAEKIGWIGTHKRQSGSDRRSEDESNLGYQLLDSKRLGSLPQPNPNRPVTRSEESGSRRLEAQWERRTLARNRSSWLNGSYNQSLSRGNHRLSSSERRHMRRVSRRVEKHDRKEMDAMVRFDDIASNNDMRGRIVEARTSRSISRATRLEQRAQEKNQRRQAREAEKQRKAQEQRQRQAQNRRGVV